MISSKSRRAEVWSLIPNVSFGPISLGESRTSVRRMLGAFTVAKEADDNPCDFFERAGINVQYSREDTVIVVQVWRDARTVHLNSIQPFALSALAFFQYCRQNGWPISGLFRADSDHWKLKEQGICVFWGVERSIEWLSLFAPGAHPAYPDTEYVAIEAVPEWLEA